MSPSASSSIALIACRVLEAEIAAVLRDGGRLVRQEFLEVGLHDRPAVLRANLAAAIARADSDAAADVIVLVYGLCGLALVNLAAHRKPLVMPRAHDCLTLLLGSKERHAACVAAAPGTYWYSPGWNSARRVAGPDREAKLQREYTEQFGAEEAAHLLELERATFATYTTAAYVDHGLPGDERHRRYAEDCAQALGWRFRPEAGDPTLLRDLLHGPWDSERFLVVPPGHRIVHAADDRIIDVAPIR